MTSPSQPVRVRVKSGDGKTDLGEGNYVGKVPTWCFIMPDGSLRTIGDPSNEPPASAVPDGKKHFIPDNPKIELDSGQTVYGCQVWFSEIAPSQPAAGPSSFSGQLPSAQDLNDSGWDDTPTMTAAAKLVDTLFPGTDQLPPDERMAQLCKEAHALIGTAVCHLASGLNVAEGTPEFEHIGSQLRPLTDMLYELAPKLLELAATGATLGEYKFITGKGMVDVMGQLGKAKKPMHTPAPKYGDYPPDWQRKNESLDDLLTRMEAVPPTLYKTPEMFNDLRTAGERIGDLPPNEQQQYTTRLHAIRQKVLTAK